MSLQIVLFLLQLDQQICAVTDGKLYFPVVTSPSEYNEKLLQQLKSGFERTINWNKYQSKVSIE